MDSHPHTAPAAETTSPITTASSATSDLTPSDSDKIFIAFLVRHRVPMDPLEFWGRRFSWLNRNITFQLETDASTLIYDVLQEYVVAHHPFIKIKQESQLAEGERHTFADGVLFVTRPSIIAFQPDIYIPLTVLELKKGGPCSVQYLKSAISQLFLAMRGRLWDGHPTYDPRWGTLDGTLAVQVTRHTPLFGYQFCGTLGRRMIGLAPDIFFIDVAGRNQEVEYKLSEWTTHLYDGTRIRLDNHVHLIRMYANFIQKIPDRCDVQAYGDLASTPIAERNRMDDKTRAIHEDVPSSGMALLRDPSSLKKVGKGANEDQGDCGEEIGSGRGGSAGREGSGGGSTDRRRDRSSLEQDEGFPPKKRDTRQSVRQQDGLPPLSEPSDVASEETETLRTPAAMSHGSLFARDESSLSDHTSTAEPGTNLNPGFSKISPIPQGRLPFLEESVPVPESTVYDELSGEYYMPVTKELDEEMRRYIRPMWSMTSEERKSLFGFLGPEWAVFARWYVGC